jgi:predicted ATPase/class 3 adenylate cyclase
MTALPTGIVTFLFTDVEGSTRLWEADPAAMRQAVDRHLTLLDEAIVAHRGVHFKTMGDAVQAAFTTPDDALAAAVAGQRALVAADWGELGPLRVRMAVHVGAATPMDGDYLAPCLNRLSRLLGIGHGGQILLTETARRLLADSPPAGVTLRDLGEHRLRDLLEPERVWQVLAPGQPDTFPPLRSVDAHRHNLPAPPTPLIGREAEVATLLRLLGTEGARLVTLTGPGGSGKTRLALEAAAELLDAFPGGVWFLDLASLTDPALLLGQIAAVLDIRERANRSPLEQMADALAGRRTLLVLDNLEQFRPFAALGRTVADLLAVAADLLVLATSRAPLRLRLEHEIPVPPLPVPATTEAAQEALAASPAVALFVTRAEAARPGFALTPQTAPAVAELCRRLDGLPLAIELAAARVRALSPADILARLSDRLDLLADRGADRPDRQRTLETTIVWSYDLLALDEQAALRRLAVFSGFSLDAAEAVLGSIAPPIADVLTSLELLIEQNLVRTDQQPDGSLRYRLLETVRTFALERLHESGEEDAARHAHAEHFATRDPELDLEVRLVPILNRLGQDAGNLREALLWAEANGQAEIGLLLARAFGHLSFQRGRLTAGRGWLERLLALDLPAPPGLRGRALCVFGWIALFQGDTDAAERAATQAIDLLTAEPAHLASALNLFACVLWDRGDLAGARHRFEEALDTSRGLPATESLAWSIHGNFGVLARELGDRQEAQRQYEAALAQLPADAVSFGRPITLGNLAELAREDGDHRRSATLVQEALRLAGALENRFVVAHLLEDTATHALAAAQPDTAARLLGASDELRRVTGVPVELQNVADHQQMLARTKRELGETAFAAAWEAGRSLSMDQAIAAADRILSGLAAADDASASDAESPSAPAPSATMDGR